MAKVHFSLGKIEFWWLFVTIFHGFSSFVQYFSTKATLALSKMGQSYVIIWVGNEYEGV
jgi:hypothetical protein